MAGEDGEVETATAHTLPGLASFSVGLDGRYRSFDQEHAAVVASRGGAAPRVGELAPSALASALVRAAAGQQVQETWSSAGAPPLPVLLFPIAGGVLVLHPSRAAGARRDELTRLSEGVVNELNNLEVGLGGVTEGLRSDPSEAHVTLDLLTDLAARADAARRLARTIRSLVMPTPTTTVALDDVLRRLEPRLRRAAPRCGFTVEVGAPEVEVEAEVEELADALGELVRNAAEAGARRVVVRSGLGPPGTVVLDVDDDGEGIDPDRQSQAFEVYTGSRKHTQGIGLTRVRGVALSHRGWVRVEESRPGKTVLRLSLPIASPRSPPSPPPAPARPRSLDVFVIDDAPEVRRVLGRILRHAGHRVAEAEDGVDALEKLEARGGLPDLVVLDLMMPRMDGVETYRALRSRSTTLPVLITSGFHPSSLGFLETDSRASFLPKPFLPAEVIAALDALMR